jgi:hypothetical protein
MRASLQRDVLVPSSAGGQIDENEAARVVVIEPLIDDVWARASIEARPVDP